MAEQIKKGIYSEKASSTKRAQLNGHMRAKAAERAKSSAEARTKAQRDIYERRSQRA
jgi:hypothetical protein